MGRQWATKADDWMVKSTSFSAKGGRAGFDGKFLMSIYSPKTGFLGDFSMNGSATGLGANISLDVWGWIELDLSQSFSPADLHGAPGSLKFGAFGAGLGVTAILGTAGTPGTKGYLFENADLGEIGVDLGIGAGYVRGLWKIDQVWSNGGGPGPDGQAVTGQTATESVGDGNARPGSSGMSETG